MWSDKERESIKLIVEISTIRDDEVRKQKMGEEGMILAEASKKIEYHNKILFGLKATVDKLLKVTCFEVRIFFAFSNIFSLLAGNTESSKLFIQVKYLTKNVRFTEVTTHLYALHE